MVQLPPDRESVPVTGKPEDGTLGGYLRLHDRPPAFEGPDGHPYTVSIEVERTGDLVSPHHGYLVFPRWALTGVGIVGHAESTTLIRCRSAREAQKYLEGLELGAVRAILEGALSGQDENTTL
jgi:hypothetical protein